MSSSEEPHPDVILRSEATKDLTMNTYYVYILTNKSQTLYVGVTSDLERRIRQHKSRLVPGFTAKYNITRLVHYEEFTSVHDAIAREKQIKGWLRAKKIALIEEANPGWNDLASAWS
ncbi:MAG TPA: GIY-YIG nuclease family protein [Candidatus Obscuribacterales bacterium]